MAHVRLEFKTLDLFEDEEWGDTQMAMYAVVRDAAQQQVASFQWNNAGNEVDEVDTYALNNDPGHPNVIDIDLTGWATIHISAFTHDDHAWPSAGDHENDLGGAVVTFDPNVPGSLGQLTIGPTTTDEGDTGYQVNVGVSVIAPPQPASVRLRFDNLLLFEDEDWGSTHMAIYVRAKAPDRDGLPGIDQQIFKWNNGGGEVDEVNSYALDNSGPNVVTLDLNGPTMISVEGWTHDDHAWPSAGSHENDLGKAAITIDPADPGTLGARKLGPTLTDSEDKGYEINITVDVLPASGPALSLDGIEVTQAVQHYQSTLGADNSVPLVSNKTTLIRAYVDGGAAAADNVTGTLTVTNASGTTTVAAIAPMTAKPAGTADRSQIGDTLNFIVDPALCTGEVMFTVQASVAGQVSNPLSTLANFRATRGRDIIMIRIQSGSLGPVSEDFYVSALNRLPLIYPIASDPAQAVTYWISPGSETVVNSHDITNDDGLGDLLDDIDDIQDDAAGWKKAYGMIPNAVAASRVGDSEDDSAIGYACLLQSIGHELGHLFGLSHAPCPASGSNAPSGVDDDFVPSDGSIGEVGVEPSSLTAMPAGTSDMMSYCGSACGCSSGYCNDDLTQWAGENQWISAYDWQILFDNFKA